VARVTLAVCVALIVVTGCAQKRQTDIQQLRAAVRKTLATPSYTVDLTTTSLGRVVHRLKDEHVGSRGRVTTGTNVSGVFVGPYVYKADDNDPSSFMRCGRRSKDGSLRTFDTYSDLLRTGAKSKDVKRRGSVFVFEKLLADSTGRTKGEFTIAGGRIKTMTLITFPTGPNVSPPITVLFRFSYARVSTITAPPSDLIEQAPPC
jgi:hypothetical protein